MKSKTSQRQKVAILLTSQPNFDEFALKYLILSMNQVQSTYEFVFPEIEAPLYNEASYESDDLFASFPKVKQSIKFEGEPDYLINIIRAKIAGNLFFDCRENIAFITTDVWQKRFAPPSVFDYLVHSIGSTLIYMNSKLELSAHTETRGCPMDYTRSKMDARVDISLGYLCDACKTAIADGAGADYLEDISKVIRGDWIGDVTTFDSVAHNLKRFFKFDINKDSGFNKTFWERAKEHFTEVPKQAVVGLISAIVGAAIALLFKR